MSYNKHGKGVVRCGNWVEEAALKEMTGVSRYQSWVSDEDGAPALTRKNKKKDEPTNGRVIAHSEQGSSALKSINRSTHVRPDSVMESKVPDSVGPRARRRLQQLEAQAKELEAEPHRRPPRSYFETTNGTAYRAHALDMQAAVGPQGATAQSALGAELAKTHYSEGVAVSVYSESMGDRPGPRFAVSAVGNPSRPFARTCAFTNDIRDGAFAHAEGVDQPDGQPAGLGTTADDLTAMERVQAKIKRRALNNGVGGMGLILRRLDADGSGFITRDELREALRIFGVPLDDNELRIVFKTFDRDHSGSISHSEFLRALRGELSQVRSLLVQLAFRQLDRYGDGEVTASDLAEVYDASADPQVRAGALSPAEATQAMMEQFDVNHDGVIRLDDFIEYYSNLSAGIDDDGYFELMIRNAWHIHGGSGAAANSSNRRVLVVHSDGSQEIVAIEHDLGLRPDDIDGMIQRLEAQGVRDIKRISLAD